MPLYRSGPSLVLFVHIPKAGGSSVERALRNAGALQAMQTSKQAAMVHKFGKCTPQHIHAEVIESYFPPDFFDYAFAVVRNPFARLASEFRMKVPLEQRQNSATSWMRRTLSRVTGSEPDSEENAAEEDMNADDWIDAALTRFEKFAYTRDNHIRPQADFIWDGIDVFRIEEGLDAPIAAACEKLGLAKPAKVPHARKGDDLVITLRQATIDRVRGFYERDFDLLGYHDADPADHFEIVR